jgi:hypothetical protein
MDGERLQNPNRKLCPPLRLPLDPEVIHKMRGFEFGSPEDITEKLEKAIQSAEYQVLVRAHSDNKHTPSAPESKHRRGVFNLFRRNSRYMTLPDTTLGGTPVPIDAFSPLISIYHLVREKLERESVNS